jgi:hypothetical protein
LDPAALIVVFISFWSIAVVGGYLAVVGLGNLRDNHLDSQPSVTHGPLLHLRRRLSLVWDVFLLALGTLLMVGAMVLFYLLVYG